MIFSGMNIQGAAFTSVHPKATATLKFTPGLHEWAVATEA